MNFLSWIFVFSILAESAAAQEADTSALKSFPLQIVVDGDSVIFYPGAAGGSASKSARLMLGPGGKSIKFRLLGSENTDCGFFLKGVDTQWGPWEKSSYREYKNLPAGDYILLSRLRLNGNNIKEMPSFTFRVISLIDLPPAVMLSILFVVCLLIVGLYLIMKSRFLRKQRFLGEIISKRTEDLIAEKEKTEKLLANVLPKNTADELMAKGKATKIKYNFVTVLFSDIQGFTRIAEETNPEVLIDELDKFFFYFDSVVEKFGIEKIKTIGDAYMCAGGIPEKNRTNPVEVILAALEMKAYMTDLRENSELEGMKYWDIRIGIHTGTVVAGVVGQKKLSYDIWGDTVNTASRMESSGEGGKINISGTTYEFARDFFDCEYRGKMPVKYKGELEMYFVNGIKPELCDENGGPNRKFILRLQMLKLQDIEEMVIKMFDDEAPPNLYFHNSALVKNISTQVDLISNAEKLPEEDYINLKLAAVFLLTGFITNYENPAEQSVNIVEKVLPEYGFTKENTEAVKSLIRNSFAGRSESLADDILHDARYDYLGRVDYLKLTDKLLRELSEYGMQEERTKWISGQKEFLQNHQFRTSTSRLLRSVRLEDQVTGLQVSVE